MVAAGLSAGRDASWKGRGTGKRTLLRSLANGAGDGLVLVEGNAELTTGWSATTTPPACAARTIPRRIVPGPLTRR